MPDHQPDELSDSFLDLAARHLAGELDSAGQADLFARLAESENRQQEMLDMAWQARVMSAGLILSIGASDDYPTRDGDPTRDGESTRRNAKLPMLGFLGETLHWIGQFGASSKVIVLAVAGGLLCYFGGLLAVVVVEQVRQLRANRGPLQAQATTPPQATTTAGRNPAQALRPQFARLTCDSNCRWADGQTLLLNGPDRSADLRPGQPLNLLGGVAEITFASGVRLALEGPVQASLKSSTRFALATGRLLVRVPHEAIGFTVATPRTDVIDLGTEFGVDVQPDGQTEVHVTNGAVALSRVQAGGAEAGGAEGQAEDRPAPLVLKAGQAVRISADQRVEPAKLGTADFSSLSAVIQQPVRPAPDRDAVVLEHWDPERLIARHFVGHRPDRRPILVSQGKPVFAPQQNGRPGFHVDGPQEVFPLENAVDGRLNDTGAPADWSFWLANPLNISPELTIDLESNHDIAAIAIQNTHNRQSNDRGTRGVRLSLSSDGDRFVPIAEFDLPNVANQNPIEMQCLILPRPTRARYVKVEITSWYGISAGLNEVQVFAIPGATGRPGP